MNFGPSVNICLENHFLDSLQVAEKCGSVVSVTVGSSLHVFFRNEAAVYLVTYLHEIPQLSRSTVRGSNGGILSGLDTGIKKRERGTSLAVAKTLCFQCRRCEFDPWSGN